MTDEKIETQVETPETNYIDVINNLKQNTVSKEEYNRVLRDNKVLAESLATSKASPEVEEVPLTPTEQDVSNLRDKLTGDMTNLDFIKSALDLRDALIAQGKPDPFLPVNKEYVYNEVDAAKVQMIADGLRQTVDYCGGNAALFNSELKRICK